MAEPDQPTEPNHPSNASMPYSAPVATAPAANLASKFPQWKRLQSLWSNFNPGKRFAFLGAILVLLVVGTLGGFAIAQHALARPDGYLWTSPSGVVFVQLTEDQSSHLSGSWHSVQESSDLAVTSENVGFTGVADGSRVTFTFSALGFSNTITGVLEGDTLALQVPDQNGYLATDAFHAASVQDYNNDAAQLRQRAAAQVAATQSAEATASAEATSAQATASAQTALDQAVTDANAQLSNDLGSLAGDVQSLAANSDVSSVLSSYANNWAQMQQDYQKEQNDYQQGCGPGGSNAGVVQADAGTVAADLGTIQADDDGFQADESPLQTAMTRVNSDMTAVQNDWQNLQAAVTADTTGSVTAQFSASDVNGAVSEAQQQIDASNKALQAAQTKVKQYDQETAQMNTDAQNLANSMHC